MPALPCSGGTTSRVARALAIAQFIDVSNLKDPQLCAGGECHDQILLQGLDALIDNLDKDTVLVLHQMGSHGPEYFATPKAASVSARCARATP